MKIRLQRVKKVKRAVNCNLNNLKKSEIRDAYKLRLDKQLKEERIDERMEIDDIWNKLRDGIETVAEEICGKEQMTKKQSWMNSEILSKMEERRICKNRKDKDYEDKCKEIEILDKVHSQLLYKKIKELRPKGNRLLQMIKNKQGKSLSEKDEVLERWAEYVEELYKDENRGEADIGKGESEKVTISSQRTDKRKGLRQ